MDTIEIIMLSTVTLLMVVLAVVILSGHGDGLIAGYNTAKDEERKQFNMKRLRAVVAAMILFTTAFIWFAVLIGDSAVISLAGLPVLLIGTVAGIIIANTWCKKS